MISLRMLKASMLNREWSEGHVSPFITANEKGGPKSDACLERGSLLFHD